MLQPQCIKHCQYSCFDVLYRISRFWTSLCASIAFDRAPSHCLYPSLGQIDRLIHQSMPSGPPSGAGWTVKQSTRSVHVYLVVLYLQWLELLIVFKTLFELVCWKLLLDILFHYIREITLMYFRLYEALQNTVTAMLVPSLVWEVLWDIASSCLIKQNCCCKFQNGKTDNFTMDIIL